MELLWIVAGTGLLIAGVLIALIGAISPSLAEFFDRPWCWVRGHDLTRHVMNTRYGDHRAEVWQCSRHRALVTIVKEA